ncbi:hypothetical protein EGY05_04420 [Chryseobacterium arthrosphaerae]|uniref:Zf-HC2 domain-containing protein n=1 Tax=Chryseobacterium arthrosphaerae TaxID=651561 RepID=A0A1B8ZNB2_9FLAO|nr:hypothetical protein [Chryseobacterium arthrosphaerae]AYZ11214.1 hypothetical protein EGY05_04420 [Chryseobacterium arthrosphaerae]OCA73070.1 hypothetical protein BBI00_01380 [Chryseobacterium arthrosphaerae]QUY56660.1 hypothetical protein I2F65_04795 [Chryseobacterium arthrosphaerae]WES97811.1 hypothetical protein P2W68_23830 [Chryseobacterium arthrosphaerae]
MIKKILHILFLPCSEATLLMEKRNAGLISAGENRKLNLHIMICKWCKAYNEKLKLLDKLFEKTFSQQKTEINESEIQDFKNKMIEKLNF